MDLDHLEEFIILSMQSGKSYLEIYDNIIRIKGFSQSQLDAARNSLDQKMLIRKNRYIQGNDNLTELGRKWEKPADQGLAPPSLSISINGNNNNVNTSTNSDVDMSSSGDYWFAKIFKWFSSLFKLIK